MNRFQTLARRGLVALLLFSMVCMIGCSSNPYQRRKNPRDKRNDPSDAASRQFYLTRVRIDQSAVAAGANKLFFEPPAGASDGLRRRAEGYFIFKETGECRAEIAVAEPVVGLGGRKNEHRYQLLKFYGQISDSGDAAQGLKNSRVQGGVGSLQLKWRGDKEIEIQPIIRGRPAAYVYHFRRSSLPNRSVAFPY